MMKNEYEKSLKRFLKRKIGYSFALLISFLITGEISLGAEIKTKEDYTILLNSIRRERELITEKIRENERKIAELDKETVALIKEGDYYAKTLDRSRQFFFPLTYEHHHGKTHSSSTPLTDEDIPPLVEKPNIEYPDINVDVGIDIPNINITPVEPEDIVENIEVSDIEPFNPTIDVNVDFQVGGDIKVEVPEIQQNIVVDGMAGPSVTDIEPVNPDIRPQENKGAYEPRFLKEPEIISDIVIDVPETTVFKGLEITGQGYNVTSNYKEGSGVGTTDSAPTMFQNILSVNSNGDSLKVNFDNSGIGFGDFSNNGVSILSSGQIGGALAGLGGTINKLTLDKNNLATVKDIINNNDNTNDYGYNSTYSNGFALILDTIAKDTTVSGNYDINVLGNNDSKKLFLLTSGVGIRNIEIAGSEKLDELVAGERADGTTAGWITNKDKAKEHIKISEVKADSKINLYNTNANDKGFLVGIEHQTFDENFINERTSYASGLYLDAGLGSPFSNIWNSFENFEYYDKKFRDSYTVFLNNGTININGGMDTAQAGKNNGKNTFGIIITHEYGAPEKILKNIGKENGGEDKWEWIDPKTYNNITANNGTINLNGSSSIGISFETYIHDGSGKSNNFVMRDDAYIGKINVGGEYVEAGKAREGNYGFRMTNLLTKSTRLPIGNKKGSQDEKDFADNQSIAHNRFLERYWGETVTNEDIVYMLVKWDDYSENKDTKDIADFFNYFLGERKDGVGSATGSILPNTNGENNQYFSDKMGVKPIQTTEIEVTDRIINEYDSYYDKTHIYGGGVINIANAFADSENIKDKFGNLDLSSIENGVHRNKYGQVTKIEGLKVESAIDVSGKNNVGVVIEKSLSANAEGYTGAKDGKVNGIANIHGFDITVGGENNVGFLRGALSSTNNTNDFVITSDGDGTSKGKIDLDSAEKTLQNAIAKFNTDVEELKKEVGEVDLAKDEKSKERYQLALNEMEEAYKEYKDVLNSTSAIASIRFANGAKNSTLIRSDRFGITLEQDITGDSLEFNPYKTTDGKIAKNVILQASTSYTEDKDRVVENGIRLKNEKGESLVVFNHNRGWENIGYFLGEQEKYLEEKNIFLDSKGGYKYTITFKMSENFWKSYDEDGKEIESAEDSILGIGKDKFNKNDIFTFEDFTKIVKEKRAQLAKLEAQKDKTADINNAITQIKNDILYLDLYYKEGKGDGDDTPLFNQVVMGHQNTDGNGKVTFKEYINASGEMTNRALLASETSGLIGMMANGSGYLDKDGKATDKIESGTKFDKDTSAKVYNHGEIKLTGNESIGMAVMGYNQGFFGKETKRADASDRDIPATVKNPLIEVKYSFGTDADGEIPHTDETHKEHEGKYSIGIYNEGDFVVNDGTISATGAHAIGIYNKVATLEKTGSDPNVKLIDKTDGFMKLNNLDITLNNGAIGIYSNGGTITTEDLLSPLAEENGEEKEYSGVNIVSSGSGVDHKNSIGIYASSNVGQNTTITLNDSNIHIKNGGSAIASVGEGSTVTLTNSDIYYSGDGYALFTDKNDAENSLGKIYIGEGSTLTIDGSAVGFKWDTKLNENEQSVTIDDNANIVVKGNSSLLHLLNTSNPNISYNVDDMLDTINGQVNGMLSGKNIAYDDTAKTAIVDGGKLTINKSISQKVGEFDEQDKQTADFFFFKRFLGQRLQVTVGDDNGSEIVVDSTLSGAEADRWFNGQVVGLEMSSSNHAQRRYETSITLKDGAKVIANRTDSRDKEVSNTIGVYINYGEVNLKGGSSIEVENQADDSDTVFENGIGVFAVNGSGILTEKDSNIDVNGDKGIGIYATTYRVKDGEILKNTDGTNEFGGRLNKVEIENNGNITVKGNGGVGVYADNNDIGEHGQHNNNGSYVKNSGTITVGGVYSSGDNSISSIGIYGINSEIENSGTINVGTKNGYDPTAKEHKGSIGIFASDGSTVTSIGDIALGDHGSGVVVDATSKLDLADNSTVEFKSLYEDDEEEKKATVRLGILFNGGEKEHIINFNVDGKDVDKLKAITGVDVDITVNKDSTITINGNSSRGIRIANGTVNNYGTINVGEGSLTTDNTSDLNTGSIGIVAVDKGGIINEGGTINVNSKNGIGIYLDNSDNKAKEDMNRIESAGSINLIGEGTIGVLLKNTVDNEALDINNGNLNSIEFSEATGQIGVYADGQKIELVGENQVGIERELNNLAQDILLYANGMAVVENKTDFVINGTTDESKVTEDNKNNKAIGVYLAGGSDYVEAGGNFTVTGGAIGIYSNTKKAGDENQGQITSIKDINMSVETSGNTTIGIVVDGKEKYDDPNSKPSEDIKQRVSGVINLVDSPNKSDTDYGIGIFVDSTKVQIGTEENQNLTLNVNGEKSIGIYLANGGTLTEGSSESKVILSKDDSKNDKLAFGVYYSGREQIGEMATNNVDIEIQADNMVGISSVKNMGVTNSGDIIFTGKAIDNYTIGGYAGVNSSYTQNGGSTISLGKGGIGIYSEGSGLLAKGSTITISNSEDNNLAEVGIYGKDSGNIENSGTISIESDTGVGMFATGVVGADKTLGSTINNGTIKVTGTQATGVYVRDGHGFSGGKDSSIWVKSDEINSTDIAVGVLVNGAQELTSVGNLYLQGKADGKNTPVTNVVGVYAKDTNVNADINISKGGTLDKVAYNNQGIALIAETSIGTQGNRNSITIGDVQAQNSEEYMKIAIGDNSIGAYILDTWVKVQGLSVTSNSMTGSTTGIFLKNYKVDNIGENHPAYELSKVDVSIKNGTGIVLSATENAHVDLNLGEGNITVDGTLAGNTIRSIGVYSQKGNVRLTGKNNFNITNGIGIYVEDSGKVYVGEKSQDSNAPIISGEKDIFTLSGNSIGVYAGAGGTITLGENAEFKFVQGDKVQGNYAYTNNGNIVNNMKGTLEVKNSNGIVGIYSENINASITNNQAINITSDEEKRGIGIAVIANEKASGEITGKTITNTGDIIVDGASSKTRSIGIYSEASDIENSGKLTLNNNSVGIYYNGFYSGTDKKTGAHSVTTGDIEVNGEDNKAVILRGDLEKATIGNIVKGVNGKNNTGLIVRDTQVDKIPEITFKEINLGDGSMGIYLENTSVNFIDSGKITVGNSIKDSDGDILDRAVGIMINNSNVTLEGISEIAVGKDGIGVYALGKDTEVNVNFHNPENISVGENGIYFYGDSGAKLHIDNTQGYANEWTINNYTGIVLKDGSTIDLVKNNPDNKFKINVTNGGIGIIAVDTVPTDLSKKITMSVIGSSDENGKYSIGYIYKNINGNIGLIDPIQKGNHTVGNIIENSTAKIERYEVEEGKSTILVDTDAKNSVGLIARENSKIDILGSIIVRGEGNIGVSLDNSNAVINRGDLDNEGGAIVVATSVGKEYQNVGVHLKADGEMVDGKNYSLTVGKKADTDKLFTMGVQAGSIGIMGSDYDINYYGNINVHDGAIGIAVQEENITDGKLSFSGSLSVAGDSKDKTSIGIFANGNDIKLDSLGTTEISVTGDKNFGIISEDSGDITFNGNLNVAGEDSTGIYKLGGQGEKIELSGKVSVGAKGFGVIASAKEKTNGGYESGSVTITNTANFSLGDGAVGIYSVGQNTVTNSGTIDVGKTIGAGEAGEEKGRLATGIYGANYNWGVVSEITNRGIINAVQGGSLGAVALGNTHFTNDGEINVDMKGAGAVSALGGTVINGERGTINVEGGGAGLQAFGKSQSMANNLSTAINLGTINVGKVGEDSEESKYNVGMEAREGGTIVNSGDINVYKGIGMYIDNQSTFENRGTITVHDGIGIAGAGTIQNFTGGNIVIAGNGSDIVSGVDKYNAYDSGIKVEGDSVTLGDNYFAYGGQVQAPDKNINLDGATLDVTKFNEDTPAFTGKEISGKVNIGTNVILDRDETQFRIAGIFDALDGLGDIDANLSFLYDIDVDRDLGMSFSKLDYSEFGNTLDEIERNSMLDSIRKGVAGVEPDLEALKNLDYTVSNIGSPEAGKELLNKYLGEMGGNVYSSTQRRMQDIQRAFENSFKEMETSYNFSKDTEKYSVIRTEGDYKHSKENLINYDYTITGLLFMQEYEGTEYGNKWGYTGGFTVSKFRFDDSGNSTEDIYSLKAGVHNVKYFGNDLELLTKFDVGYNRHNMDRKLSMPTYHFENSADINSYQINFNNILRKKLYNDIENDFGVFAGLDLEYGRVDGFEESGTLPVEVKSNDYMSTRVEAGVNGTKRIYLDDDWTMKFTGEATYSYNFGDNYDGNKARIKTADKKYYSLPIEDKEEGSFAIKAGVGFERLNYMGVTLEGEVIQDQHSDENNWSVALRFNYKLGKIDATKPKERVKKKITTFNLEADNYFDFDKSLLKPKGAEVVKELAELINSKKLKGTLTIEGHTDWVGTVEYNQKLSERRANAIKRELEKYLNSSDISIVTKGYGELRPIATNFTKEGRATNRRVEIKYISNEGE